MESSDPVDTPMVEKSKLDEDTQGKAVDPTHYHGMIGTLMHLISINWRTSLLRPLAKKELNFLPQQAENDEFLRRRL
ncbi:hypothetical protein Tco_0832543 [Tanacetum coccineum]